MFQSWVVAQVCRAGGLDARTGDNLPMITPRGWWGRWHSWTSHSGLPDARACCPWPGHDHSRPRGGLQGTWGQTGFLLLECGFKTSPVPPASVPTTDLEWEGVWVRGRDGGLGRPYRELPEPSLPTRPLLLNLPLTAHLPTSLTH